MRRFLVVGALLGLLALSAAGGASAGKPGASISTHHIDFGSVTVGQSSAVQTITITNNTNTNLYLSNSDQPLYFGFAWDGCWNLYANSTCQAGAVFQPLATGRWGGTWTITFVDNLAVPTYATQVSFKVSGTGT